MIQIVEDLGILQEEVSRNTQYVYGFAISLDINAVTQSHSQNQLTVQVDVCF